MKIISSLLGLGLIAVTQLSHANEPYQYIPSLPLLDGVVNNYLESDISSESLTIGVDGPWQKNHKSIITFDSSSIDTSRSISSVKILLNHPELLEGMNYSDVLSYMWEHIKIDIAGPFGFSGSHAISPLDYYGIPVATLDGDVLMFGMGYDLSLDITEYVNLYGLTQVAISLPTNPENLAIKFKSGEVEGEFEYDGGPTLFVIYE